MHQLLYRCAHLWNVKQDRLPVALDCQGLNLIPLEYIYARSADESAGVVLASEFSACSSLLNGAMRINPFDVAKTAAAMEQALNMSEGERCVVLSSALFRPVSGQSLVGQLPDWCRSQVFFFTREGSIGAGWGSLHRGWSRSRIALLCARLGLCIDRMVD